MEISEINELAKALATAQGELENATKTSSNPHFRSRYADLAEVLNTVRPVFSKHGLSVTQHPSYDSGVVTVETMLLHSSGQYLLSEIASPVVTDAQGRTNAQGIGSAITYCRRYALAAVAGIAQEDDDGEGAVGRTKPEPRVEQKKTDPAIVEKFDAAQTIDDVAKVWNSIPVGIRSAYNEIKNDAKTRVGVKLLAEVSA